MPSEQFAAPHNRDYVKSTGYLLPVPGTSRVGLRLCCRLLLYRWSLPSAAYKFRSTSAHGLMPGHIGKGLYQLAQFPEPVAFVVLLTQSTGIAVALSFRVQLSEYRVRLHPVAQVTAAPV
jgi:hypothetical protein